jgi:integrase
MGSAEVNAFLTHLAVELKVSPSTQNQALAALLFLYREPLAIDLDLDGVVRARTRRRLPVVLTPEEVRAVLAELGGVEALVAGLLYGSGLRLMEALRLRVKDLDFARRELTVRDGKGGKDRRTLLPSSLEGGLQEHLEAVRRLHRADLAAGFGHVALPHALVRKYPRAPVEWGWQWVFPQQHRWRDSAIMRYCEGAEAQEAVRHFRKSWRSLAPGISVKDSKHKRSPPYGDGLAY